jgi:hypothetical protein
MKEFPPESEPTSAEWEPLRGCLDQAMAELPDPDRDAILLRFFENQTLRDVGTALGVSDDAAQKRISRALERLRRSLSRAGKQLTAGALSAAITSHAIQATPAGLIEAVSAAAVFMHSAAGGTAITTTKAIAMTTMHKTIIGGAFALLIGAGFYQARQNSRLHERVRALQTTEEQLSADLQQATALNVRLAQLATQAQAVAVEPRAASNELLKLRSTVSLNAREIAELKAVLSNRTDRLPDSVATIMSSYLSSLRSGENEFQENDALNELAKMSASLSLTPVQQQQFRDLLASNVAARTELEIAAQTGTLPFEEVKVRRNKLAREENKAFAAILSPEQMTAYQQLQDQPDNPGISNWASREAARMASSLNLTPEAREQAATILNNLKPGAGGTRMTLYSDAADQLALRMQALQGLLTEKQAQSYMRMVQQDIEEHNLLAKISQAMDQAR